jgi:hypothetical protein
LAEAEVAAAILRITVTEVGEMLPVWIDAEGEAKTLTTDKSSSGWGVFFVDSHSEFGEKGRF